MRNPHVQTILSSLRFRNILKNSLNEYSREIIVDGGDGVRLQGYHAKQPSSSQGLIILIHGWEGSAFSAYIVSAAHYFFRRGFDIVRLNLRDHGESHHLNEGLFHGARLEETLAAVRNITALRPGAACYLVGYSLGGNFALRVAARQSQDHKPFLKQVFAVSPVLDPYKSTAALDQNFILYRNYFLRKWKRSLRRKAQLFPDKYDFSRLLFLQTCLDMTEVMVADYTEFKDLHDYFGRYTLHRHWFENLKLPVTVIAAEDDPLIDRSDFADLENCPNLSLKIERYGGHCGFFSDLACHCWAEAEIERLIAKKTRVDTS
jgi:predicted alpha/beta-fold hydrolase